MLKRIVIVTLLLALAIVATPAQGRAVAANEFEIEYRLILEQEDRPEIEVHVKGAPSGTTKFMFGISGSTLGGFQDLTALFKGVKVELHDGTSLNWQWDSRNEITVNNGGHPDFIIKYWMDALNFTSEKGWGVPGRKFAVFRRKDIFFIAGDVFLLPQIEPAKVSVKCILPEGSEIFASLHDEKESFVAKTDLWGNIVYDFQKAYFSGGETIFTITHETERGETYQYLWFYRNKLQAAWLPSYGNTPWEEAQRYMEITEEFSKYLQENVFGSLPTHKIVFTDLKSSDKEAVVTNVSWMHYMQIWPRNSEPDIAHHLVHQYMFWKSQSKLAFRQGSLLNEMLHEGIPMHLQFFVPTSVFSDEKYVGQLFQLYALDARGQRFGISENHMHNVYNVSALQVFLLNEYIEEVTDGEHDLYEFTRSLWNHVEDRSAPQEVTDEEIIQAFAQVVGEENKGYLLKVAMQKEFNKEDFKELLPSFKIYMDWLLDNYFWGNRLLSLASLDMAAAAGDVWPHYFTSHHMVDFFKQDFLPPFKDYLKNLQKTSLTKDDIESALAHVTGQNHSGFFDFWSSVGIDLDPNSLLPLDEWNPSERNETEFVSNWMPAGTLKTEHYISGLSQQAQAVLDQSAESEEIVIEVRLQSFQGYPPLAEAEGAITGGNVTSVQSHQLKYENIYLTRAYFKVKTSDPERQHFPFILTLPSFASHPKFSVYRPGLGEGSYLGGLYWLHSFDPVEFELKIEAGGITFPDTSLENESFIVHTGDEKVQGVSGDLVAVVVSEATVVRVDLLDSFGFFARTSRGTGSAGRLH